MIKIFEKFNEYIHLNHGSKNIPKVDIVHWDNGQKECEIWKLNNKLHREDGPARQWWFKNGQKWSERWYLNGEIHREDGPARQIWYESGQKENERWYLNDKCHREDGPAYQRWNINGHKEIEMWYLNDNYYSREDWIEELKKIGSKHYEEQLLLLNMEKYNI